jgi:hypothetical protein
MRSHEFGLQCLNCLLDEKWANISAFVGLMSQIVVIGNGNLQLGVKNLGCSVLKCMLGDN